MRSPPLRYYLERVLRDRGGISHWAAKFRAPPARQATKIKESLRHRCLNHIGLSESNLQRSANCGFQTVVRNRWLSRGKKLELKGVRSRPGKPNQRKGQNEKFMNFAHFCEFWCCSLGKQARCKNRGFFYIYRCSCGIPREQALLRKSKTSRKSPEKWTFLSLAFYNAPRKHININNFAGLSRDWVGAKKLFMPFFRVIPYGGEKHINKIPSVNNIFVYVCVCVFFFMRFFFLSPIKRGKKR